VSERQRVLFRVGSQHVYLGRRDVRWLIEQALLAQSLAIAQLVGADPQSLAGVDGGLAVKGQRPARQLKRLVLIGHTGFVTLEAMAWLRHTKAALVQLDSHGQLIATTAPAGTDHSELRRAQALASAGSTGLEAARAILQSKIAGQAAIAADLTPQAPAIRQIQAALVALQSGRLMDELLVAESSAAEAYWTSWEAVCPNVRPRDRRRLPEHWMSFTARHSPMTSSPRSATDPVNALLNYLYALLEAETIIACHTLGLDPGLGLFHADRNGRASFALDLMEACRPTVDAYVLALLTERTLSARDFAETPRGICRLAPHLAEELAQSTLAWADHIGRSQRTSPSCC